MSDTHRKNDKQTLSALLYRLWLHISARRRVQLGALAGVMLLSTLTELFSIGMVVPFLGALTAPSHIFQHRLAQPIIASFGFTSSDQLLLPLTVLFGLAALLSGATRLALLWGQTRLGNAIGADLGAAAYRRTLYQPYIVHAMRNSSEVIAALMAKLHTVIYAIVIPALTLVISAFMVLTIVAFMVLVEPRLTLMAFFSFSGLYFLVAYSTRKRLIRDSQRVNEGQSNVTRAVQEGLGGIRDVLIDGLQEAFTRVYRQVDEQLRQALVSINVLAGAPRPVIEAFGLVLIGMLAYTLSSGQEGMSTALPMLGALALAAQRLLPLVQQGYSSWTYLLSGQDSLRDVLTLLDQPLPDSSVQLLPAPVPFRKQISLVDLHFRYTPQGPWVLRGINLQIPLGARIGFIGTTGSGKSTLLDIVMGLLVPTSGAILIDDVVIDEKNRCNWQMHIAHVPQMIYLTDATIAENIAFGVLPEEIDYARVREAAKRAQIAGTIESWQAGYHTLVGERGVRLSGGQRQRIGIARALYKQADVIVFDEATSALDSDTERTVMESIDSLGKDLTILMVAHRVSTLKNCDHIIDLNDGVVQQIGGYEEMIALPRKRPEVA